MAKLEKVSYKGVEVVGWGRVDLENNLVTRLVQLEGYGKTEAIQKAKEIISGNIIIPQPVVATQPIPEAVKVAPTKIKDRIKDFVEDVLDDGKRNQSHKKGKKK